MNDLFDERLLREALRLDARERPRIDVASLVFAAEAGAKREQARFARVVLAGMALLATLPIVSFVRLLYEIVTGPGLANPVASFALATTYLGRAVEIAVQPAMALTLALGALAVVLLERTEGRHVRASS